MIADMSEIKLQVGVKIFLRNKDGKFLILKRNPVKYPGTKGDWDIVGGRIDPGTKLLENLKREVKEETGLEIISEPKLIHAQDIIPNSEKHVVRLSYVGNTVGEPVLDPEEAIDYKWLGVEELGFQENLDIYVKEILEQKIL